ncbi:MAG TPA: hypothetical protein VJ508_08855, partial [Saprospiraceae bacterium]|nr:hypothetical protein [Saprospiraceae bacterium]
GAIGSCASTDPRILTGGCFTSNGYVVEICTSDGTFPQINGSQSVFQYQFTRIDPKAPALTHIDILAPVCTPPLTIPTGICSSSCTGTLFPPGAGEPSTGFGLGLKLDNTFKWSWSSSQTGGQVSLTYGLATPPQPVKAAPNAMLLKGGATSSKFPFGQILAPACSASGAVAGTFVGSLVTTQCISLFESDTEKLSMSVVRGGDTCIIENQVTFYRSSDCTGTSIVPVWQSPDPGFVYKAGTLGGLCPELIEVTKNSPVCVQLTLASGRKTTVCY